MKHEGSERGRLHGTRPAAAVPRRPTWPRDIQLVLASLRCSNQWMTPSQAILPFVLGLSKPPEGLHSLQHARQLPAHASAPLPPAAKPAAAAEQRCAPGEPLHSLVPCKYHVQICAFPPATTGHDGLASWQHTRVSGAAAAARMQPGRGASQVATAVLAPERMQQASVTLASDLAMHCFQLPSPSLGGCKMPISWTAVHSPGVHARARWV